MSFSSSLIRWYHRNKRVLPWRDTKNPYHIWLSEIILQQTRVEQGLPYFEQFIKKYPTLKQLAAAPEDEVLKLWQGLGYYSRARNMLATARIIVQEHKAVFPKTAAELSQLKGIGPYTAAAVASFAFREAVPVVDGNVFRVLSRYLGITTPIDSSGARKVYTQAAAELMDRKRPDEFNQAIMEFGATVCTPKKAGCLTCFLADSCSAFANGTVEQLPVKAKKTKQTHRYFNYLLIEQGNYTYLNKRTKNDIWKNLFELPLIESSHSLTDEELLQHEEFKAILGSAPFIIQGETTETRHLLSHRVINARFIQLKITGSKSILPTNYQKIKISTLSTYPIPRILDIYLKKLTLI
ncbi:MAG: A/G-specific adenine glycosylase [Bacteroidia bacterium]|nr:A/G-specific adenine glycosylase [Bacteroidia bacterium]MBP9179804.1 A/G-specific adenine glycosylase [Bacteroidia bacterium]MBP9723803.1 A/G-specific adenine glycosylase [Bacteroidia bacterium]